MTHDAPEDFPGTNVRPFRASGKNALGGNGCEKGLGSGDPPDTPPLAGEVAEVPDDRPTIRIVQGEIERMVDEAEAALIRSNRGLYKRAGRIVSVGEAKIAVSDKTEDVSLQIVERELDRLGEDLAAVAVFKRYDERKKEWVVRDAPEKVAKVLQQRRIDLRLPLLTGVVTAPTLREDGTVLDLAGYDGATGLLFNPRGVRFPEIPKLPSRVHAEIALDALEGLFSSMPFVAPVDRAVAVSAVLTVCSRNAYDTAPMHAVTAPTAGSGKSMIVDAVTVLATGRRAAVMALGKNVEETEKRLGGALLSGDPVLALDNCEAGIGGDLLCQMLTQASVKYRVLGGSKIPELSTKIFVTATGNNLVVLSDMTRRTVLCRIDPKTERPELREFDTPDPVAIARQRRSELVAAALTVLRAYVVAGRPVQASPLGSFEGWSRTVRDAMLWLGSADPIGSMEEGRATDPRLAKRTALMTQWREVIGYERVTAHQVIEAATRKRGFPAESGEFKHPEFRDALLGVAGQTGKIENSRLGTWLGRNKDQVVGGYVLGKAGTSDGIQLWRLFEQDDPEWRLR